MGTPHGDVVFREVYFQPCSPKTALKENLQKKNKDRRHSKALFPP
jgi:hypothetical protein